MDVLIETELWREEHAPASVERELLLQQTLLRRRVNTALCEFVHGVREVRIPISADGSSPAGGSPASSPSRQQQHHRHYELAHPAPSERAVEQAAMHRLKYFSTRACADPLVVPINGSVDEPDARYAQVRRFLARRPKLLGKAVRAALYNVIQQVALVHHGGCAHNDISLRSLCLMVTRDGSPVINSRDGSVSFLLTRFAHATEFLSDAEHAVDVEESQGVAPTGGGSSPPGAATSAVGNISQQLAQATRRSAQSAKLAIAPNILAVCDLDGISAEKHHRAFLARQDAERHSRAQSRRPLPLGIPVCGPTCDVQGLAAVTAVLFRHLLEASDEILGQKAVAFKFDKKELFSRKDDAQKGSSLPSSKATASSAQQQQHDTAFSNHRFWSCDVELALRKYLMGTSEDYFIKVAEWLNSAPRASQKDGSSSACSFQVLDEVIASAQLASFTIEVPTAVKEQQIMQGEQQEAANEQDRPGSVNRKQQQQQHQPCHFDDRSGGGTGCSISTCGAPAVELRWLMSRILLQQRLPLPSAAQMRVHPFFWSSRRTAQFLVATAQFLCEQELIVETLKSFCGYSSSFFRQSGASPCGGGGGGSNRRSSTAALGASGRSDRSSISDGAVGGSGAGPDGKKDKAIDQHDPDGVAARAAEKLRGALSGSPFSGLGSGTASSPCRRAAVNPALQEYYDESSYRRGSGRGESSQHQQQPDLSAITQAFDAANASALARTESMSNFASGMFSSPTGGGGGGGGGGGASPLGKSASGQYGSSNNLLQQQQQQQEVEDDEEQPPNSIARMINASTTLYWWGRGEFRADSQAHKDNCAVWLRMLADTIGSSQHPFSTVNTKSGRIRNSRSDLLLFIAVLIAKMVEPRGGGVSAVKICGGDAMTFVSLAVHSRFPGLQILLIELLSRRSSDAHKFCQFVHEQEMIVTRQPSMALPLFAATASLWTAPGLPPFGEELAQMFAFWA